uniref:hypothetical protein n=1 Tax=Dysgonomonas sp. TaxID=1891233 RepID=UPI00257BED4C|nr:hypothetical protein [Dysgonomonas sp.]
MSEVPDIHLELFASPNVIRLLNLIKEQTLCKGKQINLSYRWVQIKNHIINIIMSKYYVNRNAQNTGEHEVHEEGCIWLQFMTNPLFLGYFTNCADAVRKAKEYYSSVDGCATCCKACHTR